MPGNGETYPTMPLVSKVSAERGLAILFYTERDEDLASVLTPTLLATG